MDKKDLKQINDYLWEVRRELNPKMRVPARIYASDSILNEILQDDSLNQLMKGAMLPGIVSPAMVMPDCHQGYSVPIGFVGATRISDGVISPGACGFDINCGMRLLVSSWSYQEIRGHLKKLIEEIYKQIPSGLGMGRRGERGFKIKEIDDILTLGSSYLVNSGLGQKDDLEKCENQGRLDWADPGTVSNQAKKRARDQVGTLGSGNHFLEIQRVDEIFDENIASIFGLKKDQISLMIHCGSRGLGHQVCSDYLRSLIPVQKKYGLEMLDREFVCAPFQSKEGKRYFAAMAAAANYAWANRQMITFFLRKSWIKALGKKDSSLDVVYDVAHNIIKREEYEVEGKIQDLLVHRKGATRAFPPNHPEIPSSYQETGQPVLIPGSMGTGSYVLAGRKEGVQSFYSTSHGAGRVMSRNHARKKFRGEEEMSKLKNKGILLRSSSVKGITEEAPEAYKNIDEVVNVVDRAGLSKKIARLKPLAVIKGE